LKNNQHIGSLIYGEVRQQSDDAGALDRCGYLALVLGAVSTDPPRHNFATLGNKAPQHACFFVINLNFSIRAKAASLLPG
jgi:hypothetical protein